MAKTAKFGDRESYMKNSTRQSNNRLLTFNKNQDSPKFNKDADMQEQMAKI